MLGDMGSAARAARSRPLNAPEKGIPDSMLMSCLPICMITYAIGKRLNDTGHHINTADILIRISTLMLP